MQHREIFLPPVHIIDAGTCLIPPNLTSLVKPLDSGVIRSLKAHTRTSQVMDLTLTIDEKKHVSEFSRSLTVYDAIKYISKAWKNVKSVTFINCFAKCGFKSNATNLVSLNLNFLNSEESLLKDIALEIDITDDVIICEENLPVCETVDEKYLLCKVVNDFLDEGVMDNDRKDISIVKLTPEDANKITNDEAILLTKKLIKPVKKWIY